MNFKPMKNLSKQSLRAICAATLAFAGLLGQAHAENHALIMWIGNYSDPRNNLPGIDLDAANAKKIARAMGVSDSNILEYSNAQLTTSGMKSAINQLASKIRKDDKVFIYFSGHGGQVPGLSGSGCSEGMVAHEGSLYYDRDLQTDLDTLGSKASQIVMLNDSCFSGGAATKDLNSGAVAKVFNGQLKNTSAAGSYTCGDAVNKMSRNLGAAAARSGGGMVYLSASSDKEVAFATNKGSVATLGWAQCVTQRADSSRDGVVNGGELQQCAQKFISSNGFRQTVGLVGDGKLPVLFNLPDASAASINPRSVFESIAAGADRNLKLTLTTSSPRLSISRKDKLEFSVTTPQAGYLYLLHIGSDGKTFDVLFPNQFDTNESITAGTHRFPRPSWGGLQAFGPEGTGYIMAYLSSTRKDFASGMNKMGPFMSIEADGKSARNLSAVASGSGVPGGGRYGTSQVVAVEEVK
jgi:hypothetical protein